MLPNKDPSETKQAIFEFDTELGPDETIASATVEVALLRGTDASPADVLSGLPVVNNTLKEVWQVVTGGQIGADYELRCLAIGSTGLRHLVVGILPVRDEEAS